MKKVQLGQDTLEFRYERNIDKDPVLLARWNSGEGHIPSEADIRVLSVRNFGTAPQIARNHFDTSTLSAIKGNAVKVILPYENSNSGLTEAARFGLGLINTDESLGSCGVNLDSEGRWGKFENWNEQGGVYTFKRKGMLLNEDLTERQAMEHPLLLTKLGHPNYVDAKFARSEEEVAEIIAGTFKLGKDQHSYDTMMGQFLPNVSKKGVMRAWYVGSLRSRSSSSALAVPPVGGFGQFAFYTAGDAETGTKNSIQSYTTSQIEEALNDMGFSGLTKTLIDKLGESKI